MSLRRCSSRWPVNDCRRSTGCGSSAIGEGPASSRSTTLSQARCPGATSACSMPGPFTSVRPSRSSPPRPRYWKGQRPARPFILVAQPEPVRSLSGAGRPAHTVGLRPRAAGQHRRLPCRDRSTRSKPSPLGSATRSSIAAYRPGGPRGLQPQLPSAATSPAGLTRCARSCSGRSRDGTHTGHRYPGSSCARPRPLPAPASMACAATGRRRAALKTLSERREAPLISHVSSLQRWGRVRTSSKPSSSHNARNASRRTPFHSRSSSDSVSGTSAEASSGRDRGAASSNLSLEYESELVRRLGP